jgi:hypothetical protein
MFGVQKSSPLSISNYLISKYLLIYLFIQLHTHLFTHLFVYLPISLFINIYLFHVLIKYLNVLDYNREDHQKLVNNELVEMWKKS